MKIPTFCLSIAVALATALPAGSAMADLKLPSIVGDHMVLQRDLENVPIWGWANKGAEVTVEFAGQTVSGKAGDDGRWEVKLAKLAMSTKGQRMKITAGKDSITLTDILVGEVWVCSGQSNMQWSTAQSYDADLEALTANHPTIRLISVPQVGTQELQNDFVGQWDKADPEAVKNFSAVGWHFGKQLSQTLHVPIGLIN